VDTLKKAKAIYDFVKTQYTWNDNYGKYTELGVKKAFDVRKGNDADINLSLVGALQSAGISSFPVILSTRDNGLPVELYPVMSEFNYVIASADIGGIRYLLDATSVHRPFGLLPMRCINGKGRIMTKVSSWIDLKARDKQRSTVEADLTLNEDGYQGTFTLTFRGYDALQKRSEIGSVAAQSDYISRLKNKWGEADILEYKVKNLDSLEKPLEEKITMKVKSGEPGAGVLYFNPFIVERWDENPFKSGERLYPVDFGAPMEKILILTLTYPSSYEVDELPAPVALSLPQGGGRYFFNVAKLENKVTLSSSLTINRSVYDSVEYHYLKELFARVVQIQQSQIVFKMKK